MLRFDKSHQAFSIGPLNAIAWLGGPGWPQYASDPGKCSCTVYSEVLMQNIESGHMYPPPLVLRSEGWVVALLESGNESGYTCVRCSLP